MKKIYQYGILSGFIALCACGNNSDNMDASGTFEATEVIVSAEANGKIEQLDIEEGTIVTARQKLGYIDTVQLFLQKEQLLKNIRSVESNRPDINKQIAATRQQIATAQIEQRRIINLLKSNAANEKQLDDINGQIAVLEKQLKAQESTLQNNSNSITEQSSALEIQVAQIEDQLKKMFYQQSYQRNYTHQICRSRRIGKYRKTSFQSCRHRKYVSQSIYYFCSTVPSQSGAKSNGNIRLRR